MSASPLNGNISMAYFRGLCNVMSLLREWRRQDEGTPEHIRSIRLGLPGGRGQALGTEDDEAFLISLECEWRKTLRQQAARLRPSAAPSLLGKKRERELKLGDDAQSVHQQAKATAAAAAVVKVEASGGSSSAGPSPALVASSSAFATTDGGVAAWMERRSTTVATQQQLMMAAATPLSEPWYQRVIADPTLREFVVKCAATRGRQADLPPLPTSVSSAASSTGSAATPMPVSTQQTFPTLRHSLMSRRRVTHESAQRQSATQPPAERDSSRIDVAAILDGTPDDANDGFGGGRDELLHLDAEDEDVSGDVEIGREVLHITNTADFDGEPSVTIGTYVDPTKHASAGGTKTDVGLPTRFGAAVLRLKRSAHHREHTTDVGRGGPQGAASQPQRSQEEEYFDVIVREVDILGLKSSFHRRRTT